LRPKSHKEFIKETADKLDIKESVVSDCVEFFYTNVRKNLANMEHTNVHVQNLGTFKVKKTELDKLYRKYRGHLSILVNPETFAQMKIKKTVEEKFEKVKKLYKIINAETIRKNQVKRSKQTFNAERNLEKPETNSGGN
jgi:nucleoid DNA-binding protein